MIGYARLVYYLFALWLSVVAAVLKDQVPTLVARAAVGVAFLMQIISRSRRDKPMP